MVPDLCVVSHQVRLTDREEKDRDVGYAWFSLLSPKGYLFWVCLLHKKANDNALIRTDFSTHIVIHILHIFLSQANVSLSF